ncbi:hypothetical protein [Actinoplanes rectilineatus]|uniref:hypothetical protein n=1 Tax=Actinoplanes rectilineatus TaxID=113571 RepID=UPI0009FB3885|nr:hypothetical protein [Actinoplanes rectilineatus]
MTVRARVAAVAAVAVVVVVLTSIVLLRGSAVETKSESEATRLVQEHAEAIATLVGMPLRDPSIGPYPCTGRFGETGDDVVSYRGVYNIDPPTSGTHLQMLERLRADWVAKGYTLTDDRTVGADRGVLTATSTDGFNLDMETASPDGFAVFVHSPCFERP